MSNISQWSTTDASNNSASPNGAPEGMAPSGVNDSMRGMYGAVSRWFEDTQGGLVTAGTSNAYTLTTNNNNAALADQSLLVVRADRANTGAATLNVDSLGAKAIEWGGAALVSGDLELNSLYAVAYNATNDTYDIVNAMNPTQMSTKLGLGSLATQNTVDGGDWSGTDLAVVDGGTGASTAGDARTNLGLGSLATQNSVDNGDWSGTDLAIANGGTGSSTDSTARTALGVAIGSDVQAHDAVLDDIAGLTAVSGANQFIVSSGAGAYAHETAAQARTSLSLGSLATLSAVDNDNWDTTDLAVINGGTGSSTASGARTNLAAAANTLSGADFTGLTALEGNALASTDDFLVMDGSTAKRIEYSDSGCPVETVSVTTDTIATANMNTFIEYTNASAVAVTLNTGVGKVGNWLIIKQTGAGQVTVSGTATFESAVGEKTRTQHSVITLLCIAANTWAVYGDQAA